MSIQYCFSLCLTPSLKGLASLLLLFGSLWSLPATAVVEGYKYPFDNPEDIERFQRLSEDLRCPKCQNQSLADSHAPIAIDMRDKVYELMQDGQQDEQIVGYLVDRYGDFIRYNPPFRLNTLLLWFAPIILFLVGVWLLVWIRRQQQPEKLTLSSEEQQRLAELKEKMRQRGKE